MMPPWQRQRRLWDNSLFVPPGKDGIERCAIAPPGLLFRKVPGREYGFCLC